MFTLAICTILNGYTQVYIKILLIQANILLAFLFRLSLYKQGVFRNIVDIFNNFTLLCSIVIKIITVFLYLFAIFSPSLV